MRDTSLDDGSAPQGRSVLIVGDDQTELRRLRNALEPLDRRIVEVGSSGSTLQDAMGDDVAVVVLDVRAPMDGIEMARTIRSHEGSATTPLVLVTDLDAVGAVTAGAYDLGAVDVVPAPVVPEALRVKVAALANLSTKSRALRAQADRLRRADELAERQSAALAAQQAVMRALASGDSDDLMMPRLARTLALSLGWQASAYWATEGATIRCIEAWFDPSLPAPARDRLRRAASLGLGNGVVQRAISSGSPEWAALSDLNGDDNYVRAAHDAGLMGALALPITLTPGRPGVIELLRRSPQPPDPQTLVSLSVVSTLVGQFLDARRTQHEAEMLKNEFFALVSHELLTPLTSILGYLEELLSAEPGEFTPEQERDLQVVDRNAHRLHRLVKDLMFVAQVEAGTLALELTSVDLATIAAEAVDAARASAKRRQVEVVLSTVPMSTVRGDANRLGQVVDNLISNAVKFSHEGGQVDVVVKPVGSDAVIEVTDRGIGIPPTERDHVFERFFRSSIAMAKELPGIGLGLSISKAIVEAHGGSIDIGTVEGEGSTFSITLPLEAPGVDSQPSTSQE